MTKIYLIDDHQMVREGLRGLLEAAGHTIVGEASDAASGVRGVLSEQPEILLLDLTLDSASGLVVLAELRQRLSSTRTVVLTMSAQAAHLRDAMRMGAQGYVLKGSSAGELLAAIAAVAAGGQFVSATMAGFLNAQGTLAPANDDPLGSLSCRERQILELVVRSHTSAAIAALLMLSPKTVETYRSRLMGKLGVADVTELVRLAVRLGLVDAPDGRGA